MKAFFAGLLCLVCTGCSETDHIPNGILPRDEMQKILWDLIQADQFSNQFLVKDSIRINVKKETMKLYAEVFQIHHVSKASFDKSFQFYLSRPDLSKVMFDSLSVQGNRIRIDGYKTKAPPATLKKP